MNKLCLSLYDVTGIQRFIFSNRKMKENIGASILVRKIFDDFMVDVLKKKFSKSPKELWDWKNNNSFIFAGDRSIPYEVIYIGGGNALIAFRDKKLAVEVTEKFSLRLFEELGGEISVAVAHIESNLESYSDDIKALREKLDLRKGNLPHNSPLKGFSITRESSSDGLPVSSFDEQENCYLSQPQELKIKATVKNDEKENEENNDLFQKFCPMGKKFPLLLDDLGRSIEREESLIAVVHIDGNSMGSRFSEFLTPKDGDNYDYKETVGRIRTLSKDICTAYEDSFVEMVQLLADSLNSHSDFREKFSLEDPFLPIRPLILSGDDVTFVCDGRIGLSLAELFLSILYKKPSVDNKKFTACAGVALVKPHFPFYRAYELSESLCSSAKIKAKEKKNIHEVESWIDYELIDSILSSGLNKLRKEKCSYQDKEGEKGRFNLTCKPYNVSNDKSNYSWSDVKSRVKGLKKWPHSKLKRLSAAIAISKDGGEAFYKFCKTRNLFLPDNEKLFYGSDTPWCDAIELLDFYLDIPVPKKEEGAL